MTLPAGHVDWEIEVVAVVGRGGFEIARERAWEALAGLTLGQDLSERVAQLTGTPPQFSLAKSHPGFGPTGPVLVTPDELADPDDLAFESRIGEEVIQHGRTSELIFPVDELVEHLSAVCPLLPGDLIFTGTPGGVGNRRTPPAVPAGRRGAGQPDGRRRRDPPDVRLTSRLGHRVPPYLDTPENRGTDCWTDPKLSFAQ